MEALTDVWGMPRPETAMLAPMIGAYLILSAAGFLRSRAGFERFAADLARSPGLMHAMGALTFFVGAGVVSFHRHWASLPEIAVTATGWWWAFEGAGMLVSPPTMSAALTNSAQARALRTGNLLAIGVGLYLLTATAVSQLG